MMEAGGGGLFYTSFMSAQLLRRFKRVNAKINQETEFTGIDLDYQNQSQTKFLATLGF